MKKFILAIILGIAITASASAANSDDVYVRKDVFDIHLLNINQNLEKISNRLDKIEVSINELNKSVSALTEKVSVLSERTDRNFELLSARIDSTNTRIDDLRNGLYLWLVIIGTFIAFVGVVVAWPRVKDFLTAPKNTLTIQDVERIIDAKLNSKSQ